MSKESVLCIKASRLPHSWREDKVVLSMDMEDFISQCCASGFCFVDRVEAEKNPSYKQIIPYLILQANKGSQTAVYLRKGSETRLHDLWSIGIGGHINPQDAPDGQKDFRQTLLAGMGRELQEELKNRPNQDLLRFEGIISENSTQVGQVHLGAVFSLLTEKPNEYFPGPELVDFQWVESSKLSNMNLELWSKMSIELFRTRGSVQDFQDNGLFLL